MKTPSEWNDILIQCGVRPLTAAKWAEVFSATILSNTFSAGESELDDFLGQILHESGGLENIEENLNYTSKALLGKFGRHRITEEQAQKYGRTTTQKANQVAIANTLYGGAWGRKNLGNTEPGDGWKYRGRGLIQVTGKDNYRAVGDKLGIDLVNNPDMLAQPEYALKSAISWWEGNIPDSIMGNIIKVSKRVNGGTIGLDHRIALTEKAGDALA
jgi:putative chitinase